MLLLGLFWHSTIQMYGLGVCFQAFQINSSLIIIIGTVIFDNCLQMGCKMLISKIENGDRDRDWLRSFWAEKPGPRSFNFVGPLGALLEGGIASTQKSVGQRRENRKLKPRMTSS